VVADSDGSNPRSIFPPSDKPGIRPLDDGSILAWGPAGGQIALVYQGDIYVVDVASGRGTNVTITGNAQMPRWVR
jgi:Dipeptidyl peptidase IV (DPP IV) N-terminal region